MSEDELVLMTERRRKGVGGVAGTVWAKQRGVEDGARPGNPSHCGRLVLRVCVHAWCVSMTVCLCECVCVCICVCAGVCVRGHACGVCVKQRDHKFHLRS